MRRLIVMLGVTSMMTLGACLVEGPGIILAVELSQPQHGQATTPAPLGGSNPKTSGDLIFADGFESGDTSAWSHTETLTCTTAFTIPTDLED
jgi:hypothetical protein